MTDNTSPLPVEVTRFVATVNRGNSAILEWTTATETNSASFEVERKTIHTSAANSWRVVGTVAAAGNSNAPREYMFEDATLMPGSYAYRLKQIDNDGSSRYAGSTEVEVLASREFKLSEAYPNPFNPNTNINFTVMSPGQTTLKVFNMLGQEVASLFDGHADAGRVYQFSFDAKELPSGVYFSRLESGSQRTMKRLILVK